MIRITVRAKPGSHHASVTRLRQPAGTSPTARPGSETPELLVRVRAKAVDGAANIAITDAVAEALGLHRSAVSLARGTRSRVKLLDLDATEQDVRAALAALPEEPA